MDKIGFFTAVSYGSQPKSFSHAILEKVDDYFFINGRKACVISGKKEQGRDAVVLCKESTPLLKTALKIATYFTLVIPLILLALKAILRTIHRFYLIDPKKELEKGIDIAPATAAKIQALIPKIILGQDDAAIKWHAKGNNLVFGLPEMPDLVFKMAKPNCNILNNGRWLNAQDIINRRFANTVEAKAVCLTHQLGLLNLPHARKVNVGGYDIIAEQALKFNPNQTAQEKFYYDKAKELTPALRQAAFFAAKTGFSDACWRTLPILDVPGPLTLGLIDIEEMDSPKVGILGDSYPYRQGVLGCAGNEEHIDAILEESKKQGVPISRQEAQKAKQKRLAEIKEYRELEQFHAKRGILQDPAKPLQVDPQSLGLNLGLEGKIMVRIAAKDADGKNKFKGIEKRVTLKDAVEDVVAGINEEIQKMPPLASPKGKRDILLNTNHGNLSQYYLQIVPGKGEQTLDNDSWLRAIVDALVDKGHLFKLKNVNGHGYFIQA